MGHLGLFRVRCCFELWDRVLTPDFVVRLDLRPSPASPWPRFPPPLSMARFRTSDTRPWGLISLSTSAVYTA